MVNFTLIGLGIYYLIVRRIGINSPRGNEERESAQPQALTDRPKDDVDAGVDGDTWPPPPSTRD